MAMKDKNHVLDFRPSVDEAIKPSELIQITGHQALTLNARRAITVLWHNAHLQGIQENKDYSIPLADLRSDQNRSLKVVEEAIISLMQTILTVKLPNGSTRRVQFLGGNDMDSPDRPSGQLNYSFDKRLVEILQDSYIWGKITMPVLMAFSSKYAVSLYENLSQWSNLEYKSFQDFTLKEFRSMLGVLEEKYPKYGALSKHVIQNAVVEINALAPFNVTVIPIKTGRKVTHIRVGWSRKDPEQLKEAYAEAQRPKVGRKERVKGSAEYVSKPLRSVGEALRQDRIARRGSQTSPLIEDD